MAQHEQRKRRVYPRAKVNFELTFDIGGGRINVATADLGYGGALIHTDYPAAVGSRLQIEVASEHRRAQTQARVLRSDAEGMAVEFTHPSVDFLSTLVEMLTPHLSSDAWEKLQGGEVIEVDFRTKRRLDAH